MQSDNGSTLLLHAMEDMGQIIGQSILSRRGNIDPYYEFMGQRMGIHVDICIQLNMYVYVQVNAAQKDIYVSIHLYTSLF